jgi:hypothetical protein
MVIAIGLAAFLMEPASVLSQTNDISLANSFPPSTLASMLVPRAEWNPFPRWSNRAAWQEIHSEARTQLIAQGETALAEPIPPLPASLYLEYARHGNRSRYEGPYFDRRERLHRLVLAECVEARGRFRDAIVDTLWAICEESSWCIPAHIGAQQAGVGLPEVTESVVDLFAAQTGSSIAWTLYLMGEELDRVSPLIRRRARAELDRRILSPFLERDFGWMGFRSSGRSSRPNNWNPWINGNVLTAALLEEHDANRRIEIIHRVLRSLDRFLQPHPSDGGCDEGPGYWSRAGGSVLDNLDLLLSASGGRLSVFQHPLIQEIGRFIYRVHIAGNWVVDIGDCAARAGFDRDVVYRFGRRIDDPRLVALATSGAGREELVRDTGGIDLGRALHTVFDLEGIVDRAHARPPFVRDVWLGSDDLQMMVARDREGTAEGLFVAAWGGHNAQSHNHNDVGNFIVFAEGHPVLIDLGAPTYTAKTFSGRRYEIPAMQSAWHNLPTINGTMQSAGRAFAARDVHYEATDAFAAVRFEIAPAWPADAGVVSWRRTVRLDRGREVRLEEWFQLEKLDPGATLNLIAAAAPSEASEGILHMRLPASQGQTPRTVSLSFDSEKLAAEIEPFAVEDQRLARVWGDRLHRILIRGKRPQLQDTWTLQIRLAD